MHSSLLLTCSQSRSREGRQLGKDCRGCRQASNSKEHKASMIPLSNSTCPEPWKARLAAAKGQNTGQRGSPRKKKMLSFGFVQSIPSDSTSPSLSATLPLPLGTYAHDSDPASPLHPQVTDFNPVSTTQKLQASNLILGFIREFCSYQIHSSLACSFLIYFIAIPEREAAQFCL